MGAEGKKKEKKTTKTSAAEAHSWKKIRVESSVSSDTKHAPQRQEPQIGAQGCGKESESEGEPTERENDERRAREVDLLGRQGG